VGQKTHPIGLRLGIVRGWDSNWYGGNNYADKLMEDEKIRNYIGHRMPKGAIARIIIERTIKRLILTIHTARPGIVIGKGGQEVEKLKDELKKLTEKEVQINIYEVKRPEVDAQLVADTIAQQLEARISFRRAMKTSIQAALRLGAEGIKVMCSGRLGGAEMARTENYKEGRVPLQTLRANIDYATSTAKTIYGAIGIKVWIFKGEVYGKVDLSPDALHGRGTRAEGGATAPSGGGNQGKRGDRPEAGDRRGGGGRRDGDRRSGGDNAGGGDRRPRKRK